MNLNKIKLLPIKNDASFRKFYRKKLYKKNSIIVFSKKEKNKNLLIYDAINKILTKNKIHSPKLISENWKNNFIEIEDLGTKTAHDILKKNKIDRVRIYKKILLILIKLKNIKWKKIKNFKKTYYKIPNYSKKFIVNEVNLFLKWYVPQNVNKRKILKVKRSKKGYGNYVVIDHGYGYKTLYAHMQKYIVKKAQKVKRGEIIGYVGNTGTSVAPHLHYEVHKNGRKIDPVNFYYNDLNPEEYEKMLDISSRSNQSFD